MKTFLITATLLAHAPAVAQAPSAIPPAAAAPDTPVNPGRLVAARALIDVLMPPATRDAMVQGMMAPMLDNLRRGLSDNPQFTDAIGSDPKVRALFDEFMAKQMARTTATLRTSLPGMVDAMARAYARRFDVAQLAEVRRFFETPTGRAYMQASTTIMADPDIARWQREMMARSIGDIQGDVADFARRAAALAPREQP